MKERSNIDGKLSKNFFLGDRVQVARDLIGKTICRKFDQGRVHRFRITETEAYGGEEDLACHSSKGRTKRTEIMYHGGGYIYVYLIYGMYWMLNFVVGPENDPSAVLIRGVENISGPGRVGKALGIDRSFYGEHVDKSARLWIENSPASPSIASQRIGIDYAGPVWREKLWRFVRM